MSYYYLCRTEYITHRILTSGPFIRILKHAHDGHSTTWQFISSSPNRTLINIRVRLPHRRRRLLLLLLQHLRLEIWPIGRYIRSSITLCLLLHRPQRRPLLLLLLRFRGVLITLLLIRGGGTVCRCDGLADDVAGSYVIRHVVARTCNQRHSWFCNKVYV